MRLSITFAALICSGVAFAHGMRTGYLEVTEQSPGIATATWKSALQDRAITFDIEGCTKDSSDDRLWRCDGPLAGRTLELDGFSPLLSEAVVRISLADGATAQAVLSSSTASFAIPRKQSPVQVARDYLVLGILHIATGADHLLFLLALVLLLKRPKAVLAAESAFTLSHTLTFSLTALGLLHVSSAAAEACIALSLVLIALDVLQGTQLDRWRGPALAFVFGLVHGLGFAGGLREIGLPPSAVPIALIGFGAGVEIGQIAFLVFVLAILAVLRRARLAGFVARSGGYAVGAIGAFWLVQRLWTCFG